MSEEHVLPVKRFEACDAAGHTFSIVGSQRVRPGAGPGGRDQVLSMTLRTTEGFPVHPAGEDQFDVDVMGELVRVTTRGARV